MRPGASWAGRRGMALLAAVWLAAAGTGMLLVRSRSAEIADMLAYSLIIPILLSALAFGRRGGLLAALAASLACGSLVVGRVDQLSDIEVRQILYQVAVFNVVALVTSFLSERLFETRNLYRDLFDGSPGGMYRLAPDGRILEVNRAAMELMRARSRDELIGRNARELFVHADDVRRWMEAVRAGGGVAVEARMRRLDGTECWVRNRNRAVLDDQGKVRWFEGFVEDITQRRHGEAISAILHDITNAVAQTRDLPHLYRTIHGSLRRHVDADNFSIALVDRDRLHFVYHEDERGPAPPEAMGMSEPTVFSLSLRVIRTGKPLLLGLEAMEAMARDSGLPTVGKAPQAWLGVPLTVRDGVKGCMAVRHYADPGHYGDKDVELMTAVSEQVALAIERKMDADALAASEEQYRSLFENSLEGIFQCAPDGLLLSANPAMARILGFEDPSGLLDGRTRLGDFAADAGRGGDLLAGLGEDGELRDVETRLTRRDGAAIWVSMNARAVRLPDQPAHVEGWVQDVTERRRAERELERAHALYQDIIDFLPDATMVADGDRRVIAWNKAMEKMTGVAEGDMLGKPSSAVGEVFYGAERPVLLDLFWEELELAGSYDFVERHDQALVVETWVPLPGSRGRHVWAAAAPLYDESGRMVGAIESVRDVTKRKQAEDDLRRARDEMERRVDERTRELQQANLRLRELDEMKTEFLSSASHELRTPLTSVLGFVKLIHKSFERHFGPLAEDDPRLDRQAERILGNLDIIAYEGRRLTRLINDLLDLNKIESGRMDWRDEPLDVGALVRRAVQAVQGEFADLPGVSLSVEVAEGMPMVMADRDRMQQVVMNLLSNAAKFTEEGSVRISATGVAQTVRVQVRDTGAGIPADDLERIFGKFYQSPLHMGRDKARGTGLGLTICREIVEHYGGRITVDSAPGSGSVFTLELPAQAS